MCEIHKTFYNADGLCNYSVSVVITLAAVHTVLHKGDEQDCKDC